MRAIWMAALVATLFACSKGAPSGSDARPNRADTTTTEEIAAFGLLVTGDNRGEIAPCG